MKAPSRCLARLRRDREATLPSIDGRSGGGGKWSAGGRVCISISSGDEEEDEEVVVLQPTVDGSTVVKAAAEPEVVTIDCSSEEEKELNRVGEDDVEKPVRLKRKLEVLVLDEEEEEEIVVEDSVKEKQQEKMKTQQQVTTWNERCALRVRKRRLGEEDAAFLLFYGDRQTPSASVLRLLVELISAGLGASSEFYVKFVKYLLWRKLSSAVEAGLASERLVQSEWTKIVFSCPMPPHRRRSGPTTRPTLLPRPVTLRVRPLQLSRQRHNVSTTHISSKAATKQLGLSIRAPPPESGVCVTNDLARDRVHSRAKSPTKSTKTVQSKSPRGEVRKRPRSVAFGDGVATSDRPTASSPRKHQRGNSKAGALPVTSLQDVNVKSPSGTSACQKLTEPLPQDCRTLGENKSLPVGWHPLCDDGNQSIGGEELQPANFVTVNPMLQMTADEIARHIASLRREGRIKSFDRVTDILLKLMSDPRNRHGVFNTPVDPVALQLPTYTTIVQHPMDLGTIKRNIGAGEYLELDEFVSDVRLVFENAMLFNPESHYIHVDAGLLLKRFNESVKAEQSRGAKRQSVQHVCLVCRGNTCVVCQQQCLDVAQPNLQCSAGCSTEIRKGSVYFISKDGTRVWCHKCRSRLSRPHAQDDQAAALVDSLIKKKCEPGVEPWVKCGECDRWLHQVCGLYNPVIGAYGSQKASSTASSGLPLKTCSYVCPLCRCRRERASSLLKSSMRRILQPDPDPDEHAQNSSCLDIPSCELSIFIQDFLRRGLDKAGEYDAARTLYVRALSFPGEHVAVPEVVVRVFNENSEHLAQKHPGTDTSSQRIPTRITYLSRGLYLFQKHEGMEICLFTIFAQEYGDDCELEANRRAVYIAYLDSVRYLKPATARTLAYHLILLAYFDYVRRHGFSRVHIWSCPPQRRISYVFWCRPPFQKTPSAEHLRQWYNKLLLKAKDYGVVKAWSTLYDRYFGESVRSHPVCGDSERPVSFVSMREENGTGVSTRGTTVQSVNADELIWPADQLPPIFDGDIVPAELERVIGRILSKNHKQRRSSENKKRAAACGTYSESDGGGDNAAFGGACSQSRNGGSGASLVAPASLRVDVKVREVFDKCQFAIQRLKQDLLVVDLEVLDDVEANGGIVLGNNRDKGCHPETLVPSWYEQVPRFFGSRFMFHQLCAYAGYQFDSLRRAKHSTMMILHHYFNEQAVQLSVFCRECSLLVTRAEFWSCRSCTRYALCDTCYRRHGNKHSHQLTFGPAPLRIPSIQMQSLEHSPASSAQ